MTTNEWITLGILLAALVLFITEWLRVDIVALGVLLALSVTEILTPAEAIRGFSDSAVITIAALFIVGGALTQTGIDRMMGARLLVIAGDNPIRLMAITLLAAGALSSVMSNTGTVAVLMPAILGLAASAKISPSKLLMPLAFGSSLGGVMTLIGTPPNIIVSDALESATGTGFAFFDYTPMGLLILAVGVLVMVFVGSRFLPDNQPQRKQVESETPQELLSRYRLPDNIFRLRVRDASSIRGKTLDDCHLARDYDLLILDILRPAEPTTLLKVGNQRLTMANDKVESIHPKGNVVLQHNDVLLVRGDERNARRAIADHTLSWQPVSLQDQDFLINQEGGIAEVVVRVRSKYLGKTLRGMKFGSRFNLTVLSLIRDNQSYDKDIADMPLEGGDILLVQGLWKDIISLKDEAYDFVILSQIEEAMGAPNRHKAPLAMLIFFIMIVMIVLEILPLVTTSLLAAVAVVLVGCMTMDDAYESIEWPSLILIAGMMPMATALEKVGLVGHISEGIVDVAGASGPLVVLGVLILITSALTQVLSNTTTAVLIAPIGISLAQQLDVRPEAFLMGVGVAASMSFMTPVASPVNTLVLGAGQYRFMDYFWVGLPLTLLTGLLAMVVLPILFPF
jgi:di/tricarboxylate transporter